MICVNDLGSLMLASLLSAKVPYSSVVIPSANVMLVRPVPRKQLLPIVVSVEGRDMVVSLGQPLYLQPIITQYFIDNKSEIWLLFLIAHSKR